MFLTSKTSVILNVSICQMEGHIVYINLPSNSNPNLSIITLNLTNTLCINEVWLNHNIWNNGFDWKNLVNSGRKNERPSGQRINREYENGKPKEKNKQIKLYGHSLSDSLHLNELKWIDWIEKNTKRLRRKGNH